MVTTATFAYEPVLERLKHTTHIPLEEWLLGIKKTVYQYDPPDALKSLIEALSCEEKENKVATLPVLSSTGQHVKRRFKVHQALANPSSAHCS
ncbi:hypothetical protein CDD81_973 [Ophiocordyceps australis]|uniref:Uncharacterized protein n=1 Tax=Ophiocordyceps australis TaxID=1399860 RepID=A0A2C5XX22_9HYPO|nr:hypothetical protein CDD81_973 [Ophiocordyceps australis]